MFPAHGICPGDPEGRGFQSALWRFLHFLLRDSLLVEDFIGNVGRCDQSANASG
jgi:hypothetical protein